MSFFSIIIPSYNRAEIIKKTIDSVLRQSFEDYEIILIDDASADNTEHVIKLINSAKIKYFKNTVNSERCISRNNGINIATGKYICFLDSDDLFLENHLQVLHDNILQKNEPEAMFFSNSFLGFENGERIEKEVPGFDEINKFEYLLRYTPNPARVCVSKTILNSVCFDKNIPGIEDLDLWLRIANRYPIFHIQKYTNIYYIHDEMYTLADKERYTKELSFFKYVANKPELKNKLPKHSMNRLFSMCHFHLAVEADQRHESLSLFRNGFSSFLLCPKGYNGKSNKILLVMFLYNLPFIGKILKIGMSKIKSL